MSSDKHCCVPGCKESGGMHRVLHGFPNPEKDKERFNTWLYTIGNFDILGLENERIFKYRRVCHSHFEDKYLCRNNKISNIAVPTLNMPATTLIHCEYLPQRSMNIGKDGIQKENIDPGTSVQEHIMPLANPPITKKNNEQYSDPGTSVQEHIMPLANPPITKKNNEQYSDQGTLMHDQIPSSSTVSNQQNLGEKSVVRKTTKKIFLSNMEKELHQKLVAARIKISKMKNKTRKQLANIRAAKKMATNPAVIDTLEKSTSTAKLLMRIQWREDRKKEKGRRFTLQEKIASLSLFKQSPKGYRFFRKIFILPAPQTLIKLIQMCNLKPGINKNIFSQLKIKADLMKTEEKLCIIMFDEVSLKANITYQERKHLITGLVDNGQQRKSEFADHAQVFMVRGLIYNYKQAVSYTFAQSATKGPELAKQMKEVITSLQEAGLIVVASVCDQGTNNRQALKLLINETRGIYLRKGEEPKQNVILINGQEIIPLYDPHTFSKELEITS